MNALHPVDPSESADAYPQYALSRMREGPRYDAITKSLRIPHRFPCKAAVKEWMKRGFTYDPKRFEYVRFIPAAAVFDQVPKARAFYFGLYAVFRPEIVPEGGEL